MAVARLHAERLEAEELSRAVERERLAATTSPEELAPLLGTSPEEIRRLAEQIRGGKELREPPALTPILVGGGLLLVVVGLLILLALLIPVGK